MEPSPHHRPPKGCVSSSPHIPSSLRDERFARHQRVGWPPSAVLRFTRRSSENTDGRGRPSYVVLRNELLVHCRTNNLRHIEYC